MQLRLLPFLCLYATVHIQFIAAFPNHGNDNRIQGQTKNSNGAYSPIRTTNKPLNSDWSQKPSTLRTDENVDVGKYNYHTGNFFYYGICTMKIKQNQHSNTISMTGRHNQERWNPIDVLNIRDMQLFEVHGDTFQVQYENQHYELKFTDNQKANDFHQNIQDAKMGNLSPVPSVTQSSQQILDDVNVEPTTAGNQGSNEMVSSHQPQQNAYSEKRFPYKADISRYDDNTRVYENGIEGIIKIIQYQYNNTIKIVGEKKSDNSILLSISDIKLVQFSLRPGAYIEITWNNQPYCKFYFSENHNANTFYDFILKAQGVNQQPVGIPSDVNPSSPPTIAQSEQQNLLPESSTTGKLTDGEIVPPDTAKQSLYDESSYPIISVNGEVNTISDHQDEWIRQGLTTIRLKRNQHENKLQLLGITVNNTEKYINVEDIKDFRQREPPSDTFFLWSYENVQYELELTSKTDADAFQRAMNDALSVNPSTPVVPARHNSMSGGPDIDANMSQTASDHQLNNTDESKPQRRYICTVSTINYDCQIERVYLKHNETYDFGLARDNPNQNLTFRDSVLQYLPKSLIAAFPNVKMLNLNHLNIEDIEENSFDSAKNLEELYLKGNRLTTFPGGVLKGAPNLKILDLSDNNITRLQYGFKNNKVVSYLNVDRNHITNLPTFDKITQLKIFSASHNELKGINHNQFIKQELIEEIDLSYNRLESLTLQLSARNLTTVNVSNNRLANLNISLIMKHLYSEKNLLSNFAIEGKCDIERLMLSENRLTYQPNSRLCYFLKALDLSYNELEIFDFVLGSERLEFLNISHNNLFEILLPATYQNRYLTILDLSYNKLTYVPSIKSFTSIKFLKLNDNNLITVGSIPRSVQYLFVTNNEWTCDIVSELVMSAKDKKNDYCRNGFINVQGICCKQNGNFLREELNERIRAAYFHNQTNYDEQKKNCAQMKESDQNKDIDKYRQVATEVDKERSDVLLKIETAKKKSAAKQTNLKAEKNKKAQSNKFKQNLTSAIENKRKIYRVTNEGLISDQEKLSRVMKFIKERETFNKDLEARRVGETKTTDEILQQKIEDQKKLLDEIKQQTDANNAFKKLEKDKKREMDILHKRVNKNAPAIHGKTGKS